MDFSMPAQLSEDLERFKAFLGEHLTPNLSKWYEEGAVPRSFHRAVGEGGWNGFEYKGGRLTKMSELRGALIGEHLASISPGVAVAALAHAALGMMGLWLFGSQALKERYGHAAVKGEALMCLGNTETHAGSDVANISMEAKEVEGGWLLNGAKAYVTNGYISDYGLFTAVTDAEASRNKRLSMFLVDLSSEGISRKKLNKQVWIPSDLTRITFKDVFVPEDHLMGQRGAGLQEVLTIFAFSRVGISALTLGTATGAFELGLSHAMKRKIFGQKIVEYQAKEFEIADFYAKIESVRMMLWRACWTVDQGKDFRLESSLAKYLSVNVAREVATWAADLFGAASVILEHPVHKYPMDVWASSLGEGTQDVQKLVIFREVMKRHGG